MGSIANKLNRLLLPLILVFTLGLAPFTPEPHIFGKIKWVLGGGVGMGTIDYLDLLLHGAPWLLFIITALRIFLPQKI